jgi:hypothetical protein
MQTPFEPYQKATTDADGFYRIANVAPGSYEILPSAPAFVPPGREIRSKQVLVGDDDNIEGINFALVRGGVITGRVTDADGRPLIQNQVSIFNENSFNQSPSQRQFYPVTTVQTDDRGIYRVYGLQAGRYKVASGRSEDSYSPGPSAFGRASYRQVFHPDVTEAEKAKVIEISEGSEATDVDITLGRAIPTFTATGRVIDGEKGLPVPNIRFSVQRFNGQRVEFVSVITASNLQGEFIIEGLIPGKYALNLVPNPTPNQSNELRAETFNFDVIDQDIGGVVVKLVKGATVTGVVILESEDKAAQAKLSELQLRAYITVPGGGMISTSASSPIGLDGSFRMAGLGSGTLLFNIGTSNPSLPPKGFMIARLERDGVAAGMPRGIEIKDGEQVTGVRVVLSYGSAIIRGVVALENGPLPQGMRVSVNLVKPGERMGFLRPLVDERGRFLIEGVPAGTYELTTIVGITTPQAPARVYKRPVTVQDGSTTDLTITVDLAAPQGKP